MEEVSQFAQNTIPSSIEKYVRGYDSIDDVLTIISPKLLITTLKTTKQEIIEHPYIGNREGRLLVDMINECILEFINRFKDNYPEYVI
jgi:hypothetical protein